MLCFLYKNKNSSTKQNQKNMDKIINGTKHAQDIKNELKEKIKASQLTPGLAVVLVGSDPASQVYVSYKKKACEEVGIKSFSHELAEKTTEEELVGIIKKLNQDEKVHGILVQLPLPNHIDEARVIKEISPEKDVDCFHPENIGKLYSGQKTFLPCTPAGIMELLKREGIEIEGKECTVIGKSNIVGKPIALMLWQTGGTVTICHSRTRDLSAHTKNADILVVAVGRKNIVTKDMVKPGATIIDVGINRNDNNKLVGDVDFEGCQEIAGKITPVPGGVGPMTIACLMKNTWEAAEK